MPAVAQTATHQPAAPSPRASSSTALEQLRGRGLAAADRRGHAEPIEAGGRDRLRELGFERRRRSEALASRAAIGASSRAPCTVGPAIG